VWKNSKFISKYLFSVSLLTTLQFEKLCCVRKKMFSAKKTLWRHQCDKKRSLNSFSGQDFKSWSQSYIGNLIHKKAKLVLNSLKVLYFNLDHKIIRNRKSEVRKDYFSLFWDIINILSFIGLAPQISSKNLIESPTSNRSMNRAQKMNLGPIL